LAFLNPRAIQPIAQLIYLLSSIGELLGDIWWLSRLKEPPKAIFNLDRI
jgi:hypothetical protein